MDKIFKALADSNRRKILTILKNGEMGVNEILKFLNIKQPTLSSHLNILKKAKLVDNRINGKLRIYKLNREIFGKLINQLNIFVSDEIIVRRKTD